MRSALPLCSAKNLSPVILVTYLSPVIGLAEHIHKLIGDSKNYKYYNPNDLKKMAYLAAKSGNLKPEELTKHWKAAIQEMGEIYGRINGF